MRDERGTQPDSLRRDALRRMNGDEHVDLGSLTPDEIQILVHELEVHKIELELQNASLRDAQQATSDSDERFRRLYDSAPMGFLTLASDGRIIEANQCGAQILETPRAGLIGSQLSTFVRAHCQDRWYLASRTLREGRERVDLTLEIASGEGSARDVQIVGMSTGVRGATPGEVQLALIDVTELRRTANALQAAVTAATMAEERERRKLAADLHDDAGQLLSLASMKLQALDAGGETARRARMAELEGLLREARSRISSLSFQLSPPLLHDVGLIAAIQWLAESLERSHGLHVSIVEEHELELDDSAGITFYRAVRELLLNVLKHAGVKQACVRFSREGTMARISVEDSGVGMPSIGRRTGFGLLALRERIESLGGSLETRGTPGHGTTVVVGLPTSTRQEE